MGPGPRRAETLDSSVDRLRRRHWRKDLGGVGSPRQCTVSSPAVIIPGCVDGGGFQRLRSAEPSPKQIRAVLTWLSGPPVAQVPTLSGGDGSPEVRLIPSLQAATKFRTDGPEPTVSIQSPADVPSPARATQGSSDVRVRRRFRGGPAPVDRHEPNERRSCLEFWQFCIWTGDRRTYLLL